MKFSSPKKQKGIATIIFVIMYPLFFSIFVFSVESTRYLQTHARLGDAVEMASLAVAANASKVESENKELAQKVTNVFVPDGKIEQSDIAIVRKSCDEIYGNDCGKPGVYDEEGLIFTEYKVVINADFDSWFPQDDYNLGYDEVQEMGSKAVARKYQGYTIDVAFVADFSGSMLDDWSGDDDNGEFANINTKYEGVIEVIKRVTERLESYNDSTEQEINGELLANKAAFVGYNQYPHNGSNFYSDVKYYNNSTSKSWRWWQNIPNIDYGSTVANPLGGTQTLITGRNSYDSSIFSTLALTDDFSTFRATIDQFYPSSGTASYEGILSAAKIVNNGENVRKLIIVLSDGADWHPDYANDRRYPAYAALRLYNAGLCDNIISRLEQRQINGRNVEARIFVIGFGYDIDRNPGLQTCAGAENIQSANSYQDIYDTVLELISEEVGHLYYRHYDK
ncbi:TadE/TadG family type IV pilus assembly protein [Grimontia sp. NTOU-MAR1]|uniref:TadE/TadG family type IV pilus assembly protein n=1 Tax=Grimontia sp. NTOU-MAR1 TaxID=3111011 RepID=UPI002DBD043E|nr:TadE/TadG family type IV pilus assembly protein [Grimontia sp. NTOU-MAR1]WRW00549.1 TadE/TadG family type IV pilus assembly protein [Grimontia sp. NTOU-MAR1]